MPRDAPSASVSSVHSAFTWSGCKLTPCVSDVLRRCIGSRGSMAPLNLGSSSVPQQPPAPASRPILLLGTLGLAPEERAVLNALLLTRPASRQAWRLAS